MRIKNLPSVESLNGTQDALIIEQTDGSEDKSKKVSPSQLKDFFLGEVDEVPTEDSDNLVKSGGIFSTMAVPKYDSANRREYYEGGGAFDGNIDSAPTAGSNNAVASGGTKTYVDGLINGVNTALTNLDNLKATEVSIDGTPQNLFTMFKGLSKNRLHVRRIVGTQSTASMFGRSTFTVLGYFTSNNYGWVLCLSDNATNGIRHLVINDGNMAYTQTPTVTVTQTSVS